jgi:hypothetical protein
LKAAKQMKQTELEAAKEIKQAEKEALMDEKAAHKEVVRVQQQMRTLQMQFQNELRRMDRSLKEERSKSMIYGQKYHTCSVKLQEATNIPFESESSCVACKMIVEENAITSCKNPALMCSNAYNQTDIMLKSCQLLVKDHCKTIRMMSDKNQTETAICKRIKKCI